jgi:GNAT superfamily N-acetyltransferase
MDYQIEKVRTDDKSLEEIRQLLNISFPQATKFSLEYLTEQYRDNPVGEIVGFNAYKDGQLAAHYVTMPVYMTISGEKVKGLLSLNTATHPEHRGKRLFSILAKQTYDYAKENGYAFVIGVANANSIHGFIKNLGFAFVSKLDVKWGWGKIEEKEKEKKVFSMCWDKETLGWRLKDKQYYDRKGMVFGKYKNLPMIKTLMGVLPKELLRESRVREGGRSWLRPFNLYVGLGADLGKGHYYNFPKFVKHSPFNLIFLDLTDGRLPKVTKENIFFQLLDFDVA